MSIENILIIAVCGAGLIHGLIVSGYLTFVKTKKSSSDVFLAILLVLMAFRIGKSIVFQFNTELELVFIFLGLSTLLLIGPMLHWYVRSLITPNFNLRKKSYLQLLFFLLLIGITPFVSEQWFVDNGKYWAFVLLIGIYLHLAFYIFLSYKDVRALETVLKTTPQTKSQLTILKWLKFVILGISMIWISYVMNLFENKIPYVLGPIVYSLCIYFLTFKAYRLRVTELDFKSTAVTSERSYIYEQLIRLMTQEEVYLASDVSLQKLGKLMGTSSHTISATINEYSKMNFNNFINQYRIQKAKRMLTDENSAQYTISSIAYDTGFNSLSSFNAAFKKFEKTTPSAFRNARYA